MVIGFIVLFLSLLFPFLHIFGVDNFAVGEFEGALIFVGGVVTHFFVIIVDVVFALDALADAGGEEVASPGSAPTTVLAADRRTVHISVLVCVLLLIEVGVAVAVV
jgi:hypothetical protein